MKRKPPPPGSRFRAYRRGGKQLRVDRELPDDLLDRLNAIPGVRLASICVGHGTPDDRSHATFHADEDPSRLAVRSKSFMTRCCPAPRCWYKYYLLFHPRRESPGSVEWIWELCRRMERAAGRARWGRRSRN